MTVIVKIIVWMAFVIPICIISGTLCTMFIKPINPTASLVVSGCVGVLAGMIVTNKIMDWRI